MGVAAAIESQTTGVANVHLFEEFKLNDSVAVVTGANRGLGLEMCMTLFEQGCSFIYGIDIVATPSDEFLAVKSFAKLLGAEFLYHKVNVTDPVAIAAFYQIVQDERGRLDVCICAAGILGIPAGHDCDTYPADNFKRTLDINVNGVFFSAQGAAKVMKETKSKGSIVLIASMSGSITNRDNHWIAYNTSKSAVIQMARSFACELGKYGIRCNSLSPGHIYTKMTAALLDHEPEEQSHWESLNPLGRLGDIHELRGVTAWLTSSASTFCTGSDIIVSGGQTAW